ncbi:hypothetical protein [Haloarcula sp. JP-L23]|uniref:hypothetical protein n=1 Tax=Haloarcula sp. JP-L23 TaxID=2716717 RepID=UPI00140F1A1B|nr:hypothetical protein G9465_01000 [Haloarcula sp. JP-L23]
MLPSIRRSSERRTTPFGSDGQRGDRLECELCGEEHQCLDHYGIVACRTCRARFLPRPSLL